jgi:8-oxo-dGTP pyrophosphatase MutT (NUDIX family)
MRDWSKVKFRNLLTDELELLLPKNEEVNLRISVYCLVIKNSKILLVKDSFAEEKFWQLPGGGLELGESLLETGERETLEESGYEVKIYDRLPISITTDFAKAALSENYYQSFLFIYNAELINEVPKELNLDFPGEVVEVKWFELKDLEKLKNIRQAHKEVLNNIKSYL